jgi:hypothetical protein
MNATLSLVPTPSADETRTGLEVGRGMLKQTRNLHLEEIEVHLGADIHAR